MKQGNNDLLQRRERHISLNKGEGENDDLDENDNGKCMRENGAKMRGQVWCSDE